MAKKSLLVLVLAAIVVTGTYAVPDFRLSVGVGGYGTLGISGTWGESDSGDHSIANKYAGGGGFLYLDATFVELSFGVFGGRGSFENWFSKPKSSLTNFSNSFAGLDIGLMGKYPFTWVQNFLLFYPLLGINYRIIPTMSVEDGIEIGDAIDHSALSFRLGVGWDIFFLPASVTKNLYLRLNLTGGLMLPNQFERDMAKHFESLGMDVKAWPSFGGLGGDFKIAIGYRF